MVEELYDGAEREAEETKRVAEGADHQTAAGCSQPQPTIILVKLVITNRHNAEWQLLWHHLAKANAAQHFLGLLCCLLSPSHSGQHAVRAPITVTV